MEDSPSPSLDPSDDPASATRRRLCQLLGSSAALIGTGLLSPSAQARPKARRRRPAPAPTLSPRRVQALALLDALLPAPCGSKNYRDNPMSPSPATWTPLSPTNCNSFPPWYLYRLTGKISPVGAAFPVPAVLKSFPGWLAAFRPANGKTRPQPGDIYVLHNSPTRDASIGHVGVIKSSNGTQWVTGDYGQSNGDHVADGWDGGFVSRTYSIVEGIDRLSGPNGTNPRAIWGWLDLAAIPIVK